MQTVQGCGPSRVKAETAEDTSAEGAIMSPPQQEPRITYSPLTGCWYLLTKYRKTIGVDAKTGEKKRFLRATEKYDITDQMVTIIREVERRTQARKRKQVTRPRSEGRR
jgi:hypothetical protein